MSKRKAAREYWEEHYQTFKASGLTQREYSKQHGLGYWSFNKWKRIFDEESKSKSLQQLAVSYHPSRTEKIELKIQDAITISVPDNFSEDTLRRILNLVGGLG